MWTCNFEMARVYLGRRKHMLYFNYSDEAILMTECWMGNAYILQICIDCNLIILIHYVCEGFGAGGIHVCLGRI